MSSKFNYFALKKTTQHSQKSKINIAQEYLYYMPIFYLLKYPILHGTPT